MKCFNSAFILLICFSISELVESRCRYQGKVYEVNEKFPKGDQCNACTCQRSGNVRCTENTCIQFPKCRHDGALYEAGSRFPVGDGCNECICTTLGIPHCTKYSCFPDCTHNGLRYKKGATFRKGDKCNNYCTCTVVGTVECSEDLSCYSDCMYNGRSYTAGTKFRSPDGCRVCQCLTDGKVSCSETVC
uniref:Kielin/chordin-like protein n=1 Tax=Crassostrea virginica TaxID=6565 RepID=A0A8B8BZN5_CRAVI|nr:kielin/chordin-like protein [Crassostrea virginica]